MLSTLYKKNGGNPYELEKIQHFNDFYIWFDRENRKEFYSTPMYFYNADFKRDDTTHTRTIFYKPNSGTDNGLKHPASIYYPFVEKLGMFLNADLSSYESAYKDFFYAYGFEILLDVNEFSEFTLPDNYGNDEEI